MSKFINLKSPISNVVTQKFNVIIKYALYIKSIVPNYISRIGCNDFELEITVHKNKLTNLMYFLKNHTNSKFQILTDIIAYDVPGKKERFRVLYHLLSIHYNTRIRIITSTNEKIPLLSLTSIFSNADWLEREVWDMYGIRFEGHADLRRILTDYGFNGHPLRKDFPLTGFVEILYNDSTKRLYYTNVQLAQEYRLFEFSNPWKRSHNSDFL